jgi:hypothetical protein
MNETYVPPRVRPLDGHDLCDDPGCEVEACPNEATWLREATWELHGMQMCEAHARVFVHREALERIAYPSRHPRCTCGAETIDPRWHVVTCPVKSRWQWATSVAANALSFGSASYVPAPRVGDDGDRRDRDG